MDGGELTEATEENLVVHFQVLSRHSPRVVTFLVPATP
jgi:hypothetical protein